MLKSGALFPWLASLPSQLLPSPEHIGYIIAWKEQRDKTIRIQVMEARNPDATEAQMHRDIVPAQLQLTGTHSKAGKHSIGAMYQLLVQIP